MTFFMLPILVILRLYLLRQWRRVIIITTKMTMMMIAMMKWESLNQYCWQRNTSPMLLQKRKELRKQVFIFFIFGAFVIVLSGHLRYYDTSFWFLIINNNKRRTSGVWKSVGIFSSLEGFGWHGLQTSLCMLFNWFILYIFPFLHFSIFLFHLIL